MCSMLGALHNPCLISQISPMRMYYYFYCKDGGTVALMVLLLSCSVSHVRLFTALWTACGLDRLIPYMN